MKIIITLSIIAAIVAMIILLKVVFVLRDKSNEKGVATFVWSFDIDLKFWALLPAFNLNRNSIELEFLCFALYLNITDYSGKKSDEKNPVTGHIPFIVDKEKDVIIGDGVILNDPMNDVVEFANRYFGATKNDVKNVELKNNLLHANLFLNGFFRRHLNEIQFYEVNKKRDSLDFDQVVTLAQICANYSSGVSLIYIGQLMPHLCPLDIPIIIDKLFDMGLIRRERNKDEVLYFPYIG